MKTRRRKMKLQVIEMYRGKVRFENGHGSTVLDENTPQEVLAALFATDLGKGFIEPAGAPVPAKLNDDAKAGQ